MCVCVPALHYEEPTVTTDDISSVKSYTAFGQQRLASAAGADVKRARAGLLPELLTYTNHLFSLKNVCDLISPLPVGSGETALPLSSILVMNWAVTSWRSFTRAHRTGLM